MNDQTDSQLLHAYAANRSEAAFAELARRHVDFVYSAALRMVCDPHLAEDVTQGAFVALAKSATQLTERAVLSGWLHRTTQNIAAQTVRTIERRRAREQEAVAMNELLSADTDAPWEQIAPHLDAALGELNDADHEAVLLRYFQNQDFAAVGRALGVSDDTAQKRVSRAVERLREFLAKRGVTVGASGLVVVISTNAVLMAPAGLSAAITAAALAGTTIATTATATATKAIAMTTLQKTFVTAALIAAIGAGIFEARQASNLRTQVQILQQQQAPLAEQNGELTRERDTSANQLAVIRAENDRLSRNPDAAELLRLRGQVGVLRQELAAAKHLGTEAAAQTNEAAKIWAIGEVKAKGAWKDAGLGSPLAAVETFWWATANNNAQRMKQCIVFDRKTNAEPVTDLYAKREAQAMFGTVQMLEEGGGLRLVSQGFSPYSRDRANIQAALAGRLRRLDGTFLDFVDMQPEDFNLMKVGGEWKVIRDEQRVNLSIYDEDSEAVAKMMMQMSPETLDQIKANPRLPVRTLQAYEALKATAAK